MNFLWSPWRMEYIQNNTPSPGCIFCSALAQAGEPASLVVFCGRKAFVILNRYPYTSGHVMVVPNAHQPSLPQLESDVRAELMELATQATQVIEMVYHPGGFNLGFNIGAAAGAGIVDHIHMHVVPRWNGDTNFMSSLGMTRVLPEALEDTYRKIKEAWSTFSSK